MKTKKIDVKKLDGVIVLINAKAYLTIYDNGDWREGSIVLPQEAYEYYKDKLKTNQGEAITELTYKRQTDGSYTDIKYRDYFTIPFSQFKDNWQTYGELFEQIKILFETFTSKDSCVYEVEG